MRSLKKTLACCACIAIVVAASVCGTLAYLTDKDSAVNTFTVGQVDISLDESAVDANGKIVDANGDGLADNRTSENGYHLLPGQTYHKDPTITVKANSEESYVRMFLNVYNASAVQEIIDTHNLGDFAAFIDWDAEKWHYVGCDVNAQENVISFEFRYYTTVGTDTEDVTLHPLLTQLSVPGVIDGDELNALFAGGFKMEVVGHAIQATGFQSDVDAWAAFDVQMNANGQ